MMAFLRLIRYKNLIIVALTQYLLQYVILLPQLYRLGAQPLLPDFPFFLLVLSTVLIAAGGYVINDIIDEPIDLLNKPLRKRIVGRVFSRQTAWFFYGLMVLTGLIISAYLAFYIQDWLQLLIYPMAVLGLAVYSKWLKQRALVGNLVVAFFCAFVAWVVYYAESLNQGHILLHHKGAWLDLWSGALLPFENATDYIFIVFLGYAFFAFWATLLREIIKDIEDAEGDLAGFCRTLPIVLGVKRTKIVAFIVGILFIACIVAFSWLLQGGSWRVWVLQLFTTVPTLVVLYRLKRAASKADFSLLSKFAKGIMLSGLIFILIMI